VIARGRNVAQKVLQVLPVYFSGVVANSGERVDGMCAVMARVSGNPKGITEDTAVWLVFHE
jgi:hypothetical protein